MNQFRSMTEQLGFGRSSPVATLPSLTLLFSDRKIGCFVWGNESGQAQIYSSTVSGDWGGVTLEELTVSADGVISSVFNQVASRFVSPPTRAVLAVPYTWVDKAGLVAERSVLLANLTRKLGLTATGYVVIPETIGLYLRDNQAVTEALLLQVEENDIYLTLIRQSKVVDSIKIDRSDDIASDLEEGMVRLPNTSQLPPIVYLTGNADLAAVSQRLISYSWPDSSDSNHYSFLQLPRFEITSPDFEAKAIISQVTGNEPQATKMATPAIAEEVVQTTASFGADNPPANEPAEVAVIVPTLDPVSLGFTADFKVDIAPPLHETPPEEEVIQFESVPPTQLRQVPQDKPPFLDKRLIASLFSRFSTRTLGFILAPLVFLGILYAVYSVTASAKIDLMVNSQKQPQKFDITFSNKATKIDVDKLILPVYTTQVDLVGTGTTDVLGSKEVGDKAQGEVTIYNGTTVTKNLAKGALIKSSTGLKFTLTEAVTVPAKSTDLSTSPPVDKWGEKKSLVSALNIGSDYNLASNSTFFFDTIASSSAWLIKNQVAFAGGSSRRVQAVDTTDKERLSKEVLVSLTGQAGGKIEEKTKAENGKLLAGTIDVKSKTERFDKSVGEEAETLKLNSSVTFAGQYYKITELYELINAKLQALIPSGYQQKPTLDDPVITIVNQKENVYQVEIQAEYVPLIDLANLSKQLQGKSFSAGEVILSGLTGVSGYETESSPFPFSLIRRYPIKSTRITIVLVAK